MTKEEKIVHLTSLVQEGNDLFTTGSYEVPNWSFDPYGDNEIETVHYTDVSHDRYPSWRMRSLAFLKKILGSHSTYVKEFEENCKSESTETHLRHGVGILEAVKSDYENDIILEEAPPSLTSNSPMFQITNINEIKNEVEVQYKTSNFQVLIQSIEQSGRENKEELIKRVEEIKQELEKGNVTWEKIQDWCKFALGLGKDLGINLLANIIAKSTGLS